MEEPLLTQECTEEEQLCEKCFLTLLIPAPISSQPHPAPLPPYPPPSSHKEGMVGTRSLMHMVSDGQPRTAIQNKRIQSGTLLHELGTRSCQRCV